MFPCEILECFISVVYRVISFWKNFLIHFFLLFIPLELLGPIFCACFLDAPSTVKFSFL